MGTNWQFTGPRGHRRSGYSSLPIAVSIALVLAFTAAAFLVSAWLVMLALGALASVFGAPALAIGFGPAIVVTIALGILGSFFRG